MSVATRKISIDADWDLRISEPGELLSLRTRWRDLEERSNCSFFQSWSWIGTWLETLPPERRPFVLEARKQGRLVGLAALSCRMLRRRGVFTSRTLLVSETGDPAYDSLTVEHNGFLLERGIEADTLRECLRFLTSDPMPWDELIVSGAEENLAGMYLESARNTGLEARLRLPEPYFYIELDYLRRSGTNYLSVPSANTRYQIRRALREYAKRGSVTLSHARDVGEAREFFSDMCELHQRYWNGRGEQGAFASLFMVNFHKRLIETCVPRGEAELVKLSAGRERLGYLYQFIFRGVASSYQGGFFYENDAHLKPGMVAHTLAIEQKVKQGMRMYDFLMGDQQYKRSLASAQGRMCAVVLQKARRLFRFEEKLNTLLRRTVSW